MSYSPIAPTSSRENRKRPTHVPVGAFFTETATAGVWTFSETAATDGGLFESAVSGIYVFAETASPPTATEGRIVAVAGKLIMFGG